MQKFVIATLEGSYQVRSYSWSLLNIGIVNKEGGVRSTGKVKAIYLWPDKKKPSKVAVSPYVAENLTGIREIGQSQWLMKFSTPKDDQYIMITSSAYKNDDPDQVLGIIKTDPPSAKVIVDGVYQGVSPLSVILQRGKHTINVTYEGYQDTEQTTDWSGESIKEVWIDMRSR